MVTPRVAFEVSSGRRRSRNRDRLIDPTGRERYIHREGLQCIDVHILLRIALETLHGDNEGIAAWIERERIVAGPGRNRRLLRIGAVIRDDKGSTLNRGARRIADFAVDRALAGELGRSGPAQKHSSGHKE